MGIDFADDLTFTKRIRTRILEVFEKWKKAIE